MPRSREPLMQWRVTFTWNRSAERWDVHVTDGDHSRLVDRVDGDHTMGWVALTCAARAAADDLRSQLPLR